MRWILLGGLGLGGFFWLLDWWAKRSDRLHGPHYVAQIQQWKSEHPLKLPAVKPLQATRAKKLKQQQAAVQSFRRVGG